MYEGQKVRLREYRREDIPLRLSYINDAKTALNLTPDVIYPMTLSEQEKWFESITALSDTYKFAIETIADKKYIGDCSINSVDWKNRVASFGILIGSSYRGMGYGTDTLHVLMNFIFNHMNMNKARLIVYSFNEQAIRCYKKCGFKVEGVLRQEIFQNGKYYDKIAMGLLREEYMEKNA